VLESSLSSLVESSLSTLESSMSSLSRVLSCQGLVYFRGSRLDSVSRLTTSLESRESTKLLLPLPYRTSTLLFRAPGALEVYLLISRTVVYGSVWHSVLGLVKILKHLLSSNVAHLFDFRTIDYIKTTEACFH
jgi:hypothetical protein